MGEVGGVRQQQEDDLPVRERGKKRKEKKKEIVFDALFFSVHVWRPRLALFLTFPRAHRWRIEEGRETLARVVDRQFTRDRALLSCLSVLREGTKGKGEARICLPTSSAVLPHPLSFSRRRLLGDTTRRSFWTSSWARSRHGSAGEP